MNARILTLTIALALPLAGCGGPFLLLPGGQLDGDTAAVPSDWGFSDEIGTVQLETQPSDPYSVNIWATGVGPELYVHAGANRATWVEHLEADANVRIRIEGTIYDLAASRVAGQDEFDRFANAYEVKYGRRPRNEDVGEAYLFRLKAR